MAAYTDLQIRTAIQGVLAAAAPNAIIFPWWALGHDQNQWPAILKPSTGPDAGKVHGYIITRTNSEGLRKNSECVRRLFNYVIWGFYFYDETSTNSNSSDVRFNAELDAFCDAFKIASSLPAELRRVTEEGEPEFTTDVDLFGGELLHFATGRIVVEQIQI
jgi:hypothetical protein